METPISAVSLAGESACLELTAPELIYPITLEMEGVEYPVAFHMKPYAAIDLKNMLSALAARFKRVSGASMEILPGNRDACKAFFDRYFIRISGGEEATVEEQKAWLEAYDFIKVDVVLNGMTLEPVQTEEAEAQTLRFAVNGNKAKAVTIKQKLLPDVGKDPITILLIHQFQPITATHYAKFERASQESELNTRKNEWKTSEDYDVIERLYDELIVSIEGAQVKGKDCTLENKSDWIRLVPFRQKSVALDEAMRRVRIKNV